MPDPYPNIKTPWGNSSTPAAGQASDSPPIPIPDHTLIRRIGRGSYGEVWLARSALGVYRAVKIVHRRAFDDDRPFERELAGIQRFEPVSRTHESQLNILHVGRGSDCFYYVMELADDIADALPASSASFPTGESEPAGKPPLRPDTYTPRTLRSELLFRGRLPMDECLRLGLALTTALEHLHRHGLVHRDIKPSNIVFVNGIPKLADIGLVARTEDTKSFVGTEGYLPPEGPGTRQADLFSLGKVLYELSTGRDRQQFPELPTNVTQLPDRAALSEFNEVLLRACAPDASQRYQSAAEMHADLALLQSGKSVARLRANERRLKLAARAGALVTALAMLAGAAFLYQQTQTRKARELARRNRQLAEEKTTLADEKTKLADNLTKLGEENRQRVVRLDIANGIRLLDEGDPAGALLWFADTLPLLTNKPAEESIHRIRIQQTLNQIPRLLQVLPHQHEVLSSAFSPDGHKIVTGTDWGWLQAWNSSTGAPLSDPIALGGEFVCQARFTRDGRYVFATSSKETGFVEQERNPTNCVVIIEVETGRRVLSLASTNLIRADFSPDERWVVTASSDHAIGVYDARDGKAVANFKAHDGRILMFSFNANGDLLASTSEDGTVRLWRLPSGEPVGSPLRTQRAWQGAILSHDGEFLVTAGKQLSAETNSVVETWDAAAGSGIGSPIAMRGGIISLMFVPPDGKRFFVLTDKDNGVFEVVSHERVLPPITAMDGIANDPVERRNVFEAEGRRVVISPDGRRIAFAGHGGLAGVWSLETGEQLFPPCLQDRFVSDIVFSPDGSQLMACSENGTATLLSLNLPREKALHVFDATIEKRSPVPLQEWRRFSPDRRRFLLILQDGTVRAVDFEQMKDEKIPAPMIPRPRAVQCTFDLSGRRRAIWYDGPGTNLVEIWIEEARTTNRFVLPHPCGVGERILFTADGSRLLTPGRDGKIRFWKTADGTLERSIQIGEPGGPFPVLFPDGRTAFGISQGIGYFTLFDLADGSMTRAPLPPFEINAWRFNPSGDRFASAGVVNWSRVWSARTCEPLSPPLYHGGEVRWADWSPDGRRLITAGLTPEVKVWDASTGEQLLAPLQLGSKPLEVAQWSLDGRFIVARSDENTVRVWDAATGEAVTPILKHEGYVRLAHLVANNRLITLSLPNIMRAWDLTETRLPVEVIADYAKLVSGRRFNSAGVIVPVKPSELAELCRSLRARAPQLFE